VRTAAGLAARDAVHVSYCLVGISVVISQSILLYSTIKWVGAAYLIYVGVKSLRARRHAPDEENDTERSPEAMGALAAIRSGFLTSLLNPKVTLFFLALFTQVIQPETPLLAKAVYGLTVVGIEFGWFALVALLVSASPVKRRFDAVSYRIERATGAVLIALGVRLAFSKAGG
jgi:RhtB (resistance to homoserine/threonine) family protein